ncbi:hypothetical protein EVG20_g3662 [Dentipellis fragilis]|uniref:Uncharacterized protein n=1 Tax=Dentipellis fragilis TaxID=205917 RepID=A0A4Y9Z0Y6_9AGAM|nr:hypothetical protein EVG20_g3662 [Dentipellis fragilis]
MRRNFVIYRKRVILPPGVLMADWSLDLLNFVLVLTATLESSLGLTAEQSRRVRILKLYNPRMMAYTYVTVCCGWSLEAGPELTLSSPTMTPSQPRQAFADAGPLTVSSPARCQYYISASALEGTPRGLGGLSHKVRFAEPITTRCPDLRVVTESVFGRRSTHQQRCAAKRLCHEKVFRVAPSCTKVLSSHFPSTFDQTPLRCWPPCHARSQARPTVRSLTTLIFTCPPPPSRSPSLRHGFISISRRSIYGCAFQASVSNTAVRPGAEHDAPAHPYSKPHPVPWSPALPIPHTHRKQPRRTAARAKGTRATAQGSGPEIYVYRSAPPETEECNAVYAVYVQYLIMQGDSMGQADGPDSETGERDDDKGKLYGMEIEGGGLAVLMRCGR